jgi:DNA-directed RNA polymerase subunit RPC12/RpoP
MGKAADWLREERRKVLGDWAAVCLRCGSAQRWFEEFEFELPDRCPACGGAMLHRCPSCSAPFSSVFAVECEQCAAQLRPAELLGVSIRKKETKR